MNILSLFDLTGNMVAEWIKNGHTATIVDIQHPPGITRDGPLTKIGADLIKWTPTEKYDIVFCFPPCTDLASSGARWWKKKEQDNPGTLDRALALFDRARYIAASQTTVWFLENPVGRLATFRGKPNYSFNPCDYGGYLSPEGDAYTKKTCLWAGPGFVMPLKKPVKPTEGSKMHLIPPGPERANLRSATPRGFARAVYLTHKDLKNG